MYKTQQINSIEEAIKGFIGETAPYFALTNLQILEDDTLQGEFIQENYTFGEASLISAAETARHLAVLGSCALCLKNPVKTKHYYLTNQGAILNNQKATTLQLKENQQQRTYIAQARVTMIDLCKRIAKVETKLFTHDKILLTCIESNYNILSNELFKKLFKKHNTKFIITSVPNPYTKSLPICNLNYTDNILSCDTGVIEGEQCLGHFDHYPAVPIAMLGSIMAEIGGMHLKKQLDNDNFKYYIKSGILTASKLTFFGETIFIKSMKIDDDKTIHKYLITGTDKDSNELGKLEVIFDSYEL